MTRTKTVLRESPPPIEAGSSDTTWDRKRRPVYTYPESYVQVPWITTVNKYPIVQVVSLEDALKLARYKIALERKAPK